MKRLISATIVLMMAAVFAADAQAPMVSVRLKVNKAGKKDYKTTYQSVYGTSRERSGTETVIYAVELSNMSSAPVKDVTIKWAVLIKSSSSTLRVVDGERKCDLELGQKYAFETDPVELSNSTYDSSYYGNRYKYGAEVAGYAVEVWAGGRVIATDIAPQDTKKRIEALKAPAKAGGPAGAPPVRKF